MKKYILIGDYIDSKNDRDRHYISPHRLCELYNVNPDECIFIKHPEDRELETIDKDNFIVLTPRYDGNYTLQ